MNKTIRHVVFPLITALIWGSAFIFQGQVADKIGSFTFNASRSFIAFMFLLVLAFSIDKFKEHKKINVEKPDGKNLIIGGMFCGFALFAASNLQQFGIIGATEVGGRVLTEGDSAFITALYIILTPISGIFFKKKTTINIWFASIIAVLALFFICGASLKMPTIYHLALFACAIGFTVHILVVDHYTQIVDGVKLSCVQFLFAGVFSLICAIIFEKIDFSALAECALPILYVGIFSSGIAYTLQILAQKGSNPTFVSILLSLESVFALLCEFIVGLINNNVKPHSPLQLLGCALMVVAIIFAQFNIFEYIRKKHQSKDKENRVE